jgi:hypothetical protein
MWERGHDVDSVFGPGGKMPPNTAGILKLSQKVFHYI